jgi:hypothetical protein
MSRRPVQALVWGFAAMLLAAAGGADTVRLTNGNRFENVIAEETADGVTIRFSYGDMVLPRSLVAGVDKAGSTLAVYLAAASRLAADPEATAADWLQLAIEARAAGLEDGYRRALLRAADLDPQLPGLAERLGPLDYVWDSDRGRWVPFTDSRAGRVEAERRQAEVAERREAARESERRRLVEAIELLALARLSESLEARPDPGPTLPTAGIPVVRYVGVPHGEWGWRPSEHNRRTMRELERRQPGSLLPVGPPPRENRGRMVGPDEPTDAGERSGSRSGGR